MKHDLLNAKESLQDLKKYVKVHETIIVTAIIFIVAIALGLLMKGLV